MWFEKKWHSKYNDGKLDSQNKTLLGSMEGRAGDNRALQTYAFCLIVFWY